MASDPNPTIVSRSEPDPVNNEYDPLLERSTSAKPSSWTESRAMLLVGPGLFLCIFAVGFDVSFISANFSSRIASAMHEVQNASWIVLGFTVTESCLQPLYAHGSRIYGKRRAILVAATAMALGFLLCSLSSLIWELAIARVVVGVGSAGLQFMVIIIINDLVELHNLALWKSVTVAVRTAANVLGGPVGALIIDSSNYQIAFLVQFLLMAIGIIALYFTLHLRTSADQRTASQRIDYFGAILLLFAVATPLFAINLGGQLLPWNNWVVILLLALTPLLILLFYQYESRFAISRIVPTKFARIPAVWAVFLYGLPVNFAFDQLLFSFSTYLEVRAIKEPSSSGFSDWALPCVYLGQPIGSTVAGILIRRYRKFKPFMQVNVVINLVLWILFAAGKIHPEDPKFALFLLFVGFNNGFSEASWLVALLSLADAQDQPQLYAFYDLGLSISGDLGIAVSFTVTNTLVKSRLVERLAGTPNASEIIRRSTESFDYVRKLPRGVRNIVLDAFISSTETAFAVSSAVLILGIMGAVILREGRLTASQQ